MLKILLSVFLLCAAILGQNPIADALSVRGNLLMDSAEGMASIGRSKPFECTGCSPDLASPTAFGWGGPGSGLLLLAGAFASSSGSCRPLDCTPESRCNFKIDIMGVGAYPIILRAGPLGGPVVNINVTSPADDGWYAIETLGGDKVDCGSSKIYKVSGLIGTVWDSIEIKVTCTACKLN